MKGILREGSGGGDNKEAIPAGRGKEEIIGRGTRCAMRGACPVLCRRLPRGRGDIRVVIEDGEAVEMEERVGTAVDTGEERGAVEWALEIGTAGGGAGDRRDEETTGVRIETVVVVEEDEEQ